jgi:hypothetical protein
VAAPGMLRLQERFLAEPPRRIAPYDMPPVLLPDDLLPLVPLLDGVALIRPTERNDCPCYQSRSAACY